jgi:transcriptional regulator with XRE-family HTH domain
MPRKKSVLRKKESNLSIRESLGISQEDYAAFCGLSKSMLSMIEIGKRDWPIGKGKNDHELIMAYLEASQNPSDISQLALPDPWEKDIWQKRLLQNQGELIRIKQLEKKMAFHYKAGQNLLRACLVLKEKFPEKAAKKEKLISLWEFLARDKIRKYNLEEQDWVQLKKQSLLAEEALLKKVLAAFT